MLPMLFSNLKSIACISITVFIDSFRCNVYCTIFPCNNTMEKRRRREYFFVLERFKGSSRKKEASKSLFSPVEKVTSIIIPLRGFTSATLIPSSIFPA